MDALVAHLDRRVAALGLDGAAAEELLAASDALYADFRLRRALSDPASDADQRAQLVQALFGTKISAAATKALIEIAAEAETGKELERLVERQGLRAFLANISKLDDIQDQLFKIARLIEADHELQAKLTDPNIDLAARQGLLASLLTTQAPAVRTLAARALRARFANVIRTLDQYVTLAGEIKSHRIAVVTVASPLTQSQRSRLQVQLARIYGGGVDIEERIDPQVIGGVKIQIADDLIDGSIERKLAQARQEIGDR